MKISKSPMKVRVCIVKDRRVLLVLHSKAKRWLFPGGRIGKNEMPHNTAVREAKEETGYSIQLLNYGLVKKSKNEVGTLPMPIHISLYDTGNNTVIPCMHYVGTVVKGDMSKNKESDDIGWFTKSEIQKMKNINEDIRSIAIYVIKTKIR
ncbi:MAG: NUDIX domain-containing protein [Candidatus Marsarchaeota archaeon]|nr:NUDIX domain-containing protein [Candidatus Marsarchaeota archaeon]